jgi:hypothetical protein
MVMTLLVVFHRFVICAPDGAEVVLGQEFDGEPVADDLLLTPGIIPLHIGGFCISPQKGSIHVCQLLVNDHLPLDAQRFLLPQEVLRRPAAQFGHP